MNLRILMECSGLMNIQTCMNNWSRKETDKLDIPGEHHSKNGGVQEAVP